MVKIQILGGSCSSSDRLAKNAEDAARELDLDYRLQRVTSYHHIAQFGMLPTPALVVNGQIRSSGKVLEKEEIKQLLSA
jgi:small redox-active disulfide protein 2